MFDHLLWNKHEDEEDVDTTVLQATLDMANKEVREWHIVSDESVWCPIDLHFDIVWNTFGLQFYLNDIHLTKFLIGHLLLYFRYISDENPYNTYGFYKKKNYACNITKRHFISFPHTDTFRSFCSRSFLKTFWQQEKLLMISMFSSCYNIFNFTQ